MKKTILRVWRLIALIVCLLHAFLSCDIAGTQPTVPNDPPVINPVPVNPDTPAPEKPPLAEPVDPETPVEPEMYDVVFALYDGTTLRFWDGEMLHNGYTGSIVDAGLRRLAIDDVLYWFDAHGHAEYSEWLPVVPDAVKAVPVDGSRATVVYEDDIYTLEDISPEEAYALGALYRHYTRIFINSVEYEHWYLHEFEVDRIVVPSSGHFLIQDVKGFYHNMTDSKEISLAYDNGIMLYNLSSQHGYIADSTGEYEVTWVMNWVDHNNWQLADGVWYSDHGYTWSAATGVVSDATAMYCWNYYETYPTDYDAPYPEKPYIVAAGVREENSEDVSYWIETVTATLYRYIHSTDSFTPIVELYEPPMTREGGWNIGQNLDPEIIDGFLYYHEGGSIKRYEFATGLVSVFSTDQELIPWE